MEVGNAACSGGESSHFGDQHCENGVRYGTVFDHFAELEETCSLIDDLPRICRDFIALEASQERFTRIVDKYQEQPHLLDPHFECLTSKLFGLALQEDAPPPLTHQAFKYIYFLSKMRGAKVIVRWFSHEVADLEPTLNLLQQQDRTDYQTWETRYVLLLWLSIIVMIPFDLSRLDGSASPTQHRTISRLLDLAQLYLAVTDKSQDAAALLCAKLLSRPDVQKLKLATFLDWALEVVVHTDGSTMQGMIYLRGVLRMLATLFKLSKREEVVDFAGPVLEKLTNCNFTYSENTLLRKLNMKLVQRLGLTFLKSRIASWRYHRGSRSLETLLAAGSQAKRSSSTEIGAVKEPTKDDEDEEEFDVPQEIEEVLEMLLTGLRDPDTVVRWSAAKGVGRITGRLPKELADEVLGSLLESFNSQDSDSTWHGGCLALAELGRRGLLLPHRLHDVVPVVLKALVYDERRGSYSVGSHVRDAACYVCWAFARAYEPEEMRDHVQDIARGLVVNMIFDREVNCRKAASAAFQENVGRQGTFPHGIEILTIADYFTVGILSHSYLSLSVSVGTYPEYARPLIDHLVQKKLGHWDSSLRELSSLALHNLTALDPEYMLERVLPQTLNDVTSPDLCLRHGSLYALAEITFALYKHASGSGRDLHHLMGDNVIGQLFQVISRLEEAQVFRGAGGEVMRPAVLKFIERCCQSQLAAHQSSIVHQWQKIIDDNFSHAEELIRERASQALSALCTHAYCAIPELTATAQETLVNKYLQELRTASRFARMGFAMGLGALPQKMLHGKLNQVLSSLCVFIANFANIPTEYTEARRDALKAMVRICSCVGVASEGSSDHTLCKQNITEVLDTLFISLTDYTTDRRGDIGAIVREAGMVATCQLCQMLAEKEPSLLPPDVVKKLTCHLVQQSNEKIDRTRNIACRLLLDVVHYQPALVGIPCHSKLLEIFDRSSTAEVNWIVAQSSFPYTVQLLDLEPYRYHTLLGMVVSVGGLTESTVRSSSASLLGYLKNIVNSVDLLEPFVTSLLSIAGDHQANNRVMIPMFRTLDFLLSNGVFDVFESQEHKHAFPMRLLELLKSEVKKSSTPIKTLCSINVFCGLLQFSSIRRNTLSHLFILLGSSLPKVRRCTADQLYMMLMTYDDIIPVEVYEDVTDILSETTWDGPIEFVREQRNKLCQLLSIPVPKAKVGVVTKKPKQEDDTFSYRDLIGRVGY